MNRFFLFSSLLTGRPASGYFPLLTSGFQRSLGPTNLFNKRGGETVHLTQGPHDAAVHDARHAGMPLPYSQARVHFKPKRTVLVSSSKVHIEISRGDATR